MEDACPGMFGLIHRHRPGRPLAVVFAIFALLVPASPQTPSFGRIKNFKMPLGYYEGAHQGQARSILTGIEATPQPDGTYLIKQLHLETYKENGQRELIADSPECRFDQKDRVASSSAPIDVRTADTNLVMKGVGFEWRQSGSSLVISNKVHTVLRQEAASALLRPGGDSAPPAKTSDAPRETMVDSGHFKFSTESNLAVYSGSVKVADADMDMDCRTLTLHRRAAGGGIQSIVAEHDVTLLVKKDGTRATGDRAVYTATNEMIEVTGNPFIKRPDGTLKADVVRMDRAQGSLHARGNVDSTYIGDAFSRTNTPARQPVREPHNIRILAAAFDYFGNTNHAVYNGPVKVLDPEMEMTCMTLNLHRGNNGNRIDSIVADGDVAILLKKDQIRASGAHAVYTAATDIFELDGNPVLHRPDGDLSANHISVDRAAGALHARGDVDSTYRADEVANPAPGVSRTPAPNSPSRDIRIRSNKFDYLSQTSQGVYLGNVRAVDPEMELTCGKLAVQRSATGNRMDRITAEETVGIFIKKDRIRASGERAVYTASNDIVELTGNPFLERTNGTLRAQRVTVERNTGTLRANGAVDSLYRADAFARANTGTASGPAPREVRVRADNFEFQSRTNRAVYAGAVQVNDAEMDLNCRLLTVNGEGGAGKVHDIIADQDVAIFVRKDQIRASGAKAVYTTATDTILLTGDPELFRPGGYMRAERVLMDRARGTFRAVGNSWSRQVAGSADNGGDSPLPFGAPRNRSTKPE
jgi:lipopolysaccharide export system protein LptA